MLTRAGSNLKCAVYGDTHTAVEKTNFGGQDLGGGGLTYIKNSSGWSKAELVVPTTPDGYELVFGPTGGANNAAGVSVAVSSLLNKSNAALLVHGFRFLEPIRR
jgi:hypothetical protein